MLRKRLNTCIYIGVCVCACACVCYALSKIDFNKKQTQGLGCLIIKIRLQKKQLL